MRIGQVAADTSLSVDAIRFYEREGLIAQSERNRAGYRLYHEKDVRRLRSIGRAQSLGFTLHEIRELLMLDDHGYEGCSHAQEMIAVKLEQVRENLQALRELEASLAKAQAGCRGALTESEHCQCPVLRHLNTGTE